MKTVFRLLVVNLALAALVASAAEKAKIRLAPMPGIGHLVPELAKGLGYFQAEGIEVETINVMNYRDEDFYSTELLNDGTMDAEICWYQRVVFGIGNGQPARAVLLIENSPHLTISVANRLADEIHSAADFKGRTIADSAGFSTRRYLTDVILQRAGLSKDGYIPAPPEWSAKLPLLTDALRAGKVDIVACMEPMTSQLQATHLVTPIYDLSTGDGTRRALGEVWPARCLYVSPQFMREHPDDVQHLVTAFVRAMRFLNTHTAEEIAAKLPSDYFAPDINNDLWAEYKRAKVDEIAKVLPGLVHDDFSIPPSSAKFACEVLMHTEFDDSPEGKYRRAGAQSGKVRSEDTYDNRFVEEAMRRFPAADKK